MNLNKVFLVGRLTADPEARTTPGGQTVVTLRIATNRVWNNRQTNQKQEEVEFHTVVAWSRLAEIAQKYLIKGQLVMIEGRLQTRSWQGADGVKRYRTEIVAENLQLGPKASGVSYSAPAGQPAPTRGPAPAKASGLPAGQAGNGTDDIPIIDEDAPVSNPVVSDSDVTETEIDLKDIPF